MKPHFPSLRRNASALLFGLILVLCATFVHAQNVRYDGVVQSRSGAPAPGAYIAVCTDSATTSVTPCTPTVPLCSSLTDVSCTQPNPLQADGLGNYHFYISKTAVPVILQFYGSTLTTSFLPDQTLGAASSSGGSGPALQVNSIPLLSQLFLSLDPSTSAGVGSLGITFVNTLTGHVQATVSASNPSVLSITAKGGADIGTANAYVSCPGTPNPTVGPGLQIQFVAANANTGASTFNLCSTGAAPIVKGGLTALSGGEIGVGQLVSLEYTFAGNWQLINPATGGVLFKTNGNANAIQGTLDVESGNNVNTFGSFFCSNSGFQLLCQAGGVIDLTSTANTAPGSGHIISVVLPDVGSVNAYQACDSSLNTLKSGTQVQFTAANTNTGSSTFTWCSNAAATIVKGGGSNIVAGDIVANQLVYLLFTSNSTWQILNPSVIGGSGSVSGQANGQFTVGTGASSINTTAGAQITSKMSGADLCTRIRNAFAACSTTSACHVVVDEGGKQTCAVQPFLTSAGNSVSGFAEVWSNGSPLNLWLDGISTIQHGSAFSFDGHGATGSSAGTSGGVANTNLTICNPALMTCANGGFLAESGTVTATSYSSNTLTITVSGAPFTTCQANGVCTNTGSNQPSTCDTGHAGTNGCVNMVAQWRLLCINNSSTANNNGCFAYQTTVSYNGNQSFTVYSQSALSNCASSCGTVYLDTPVIADSCDNGCSGGTYENEIKNFSIQGMFFPGSGGFVHAAGEELTQGHQIQVFNTMAYYWRFDQSSAYGGAPNGDTNSGPYGPFSGNMHNVQCQKAGGCSCSGTNGACSAGSAPSGSSMFCGGTTTNTSFASISPDPCTNPNFVAALFTGATGSQGPDRIDHMTESISTLQGSSISDFAGTGDHQGTAVGVFGTQAELSHNHGEYFPTNFALCGDSTRQNMWYQAYHSIQTGSVLIRGGLNGSNTSLYFDIGNASTVYGSANLCNGLHIEHVFGGTGGSSTLVDNVTGHDMLQATDAPVDFFLGTGNNPPVRTSEGSGGFSGPVSFPFGSCPGAIGQTASTTYAIPPYAGASTNPCQSTTITGIAAPHKCIAQNLTVQLDHAPASGDTLTFKLEDITTSTATLTCTITGTSNTTCSDVNTGNSRNTTHNITVNQNDVVAPVYSPSQSTDATALGIHVSWDCF